MAARKKKKTTRKRVRLTKKDRARATNHRLTGFYTNNCKCDAELVEKVHDLAEEGLPLDTIIGILCISARTAKRWVARGKMFEENGGKPKTDLCYAAFFQQYQRGRENYKAKLLRKYNKAILSDDIDPNELRAITHAVFEYLKRADKKNWSAIKLDQDVAEESSQDADFRYL